MRTSVQPIVPPAWLASTRGLARALALSRAAAAAACLLCAAPVQAAVTIVGDDEVIVQAAEVIDDDLVVWAPYVRVDGVVKGDLTILAQDVVVEGIVEQDLLVVAKTLYLGGSVNDDARVAAFAVALGEDAVVADDFWTAGYSFEARAGSRIGGSLNAASKQLLLAGQVVEDVRTRCGALELQGLIGGSLHAVVGGLEGVSHSNLVIDIDLEIPPVPDGLTLSGSAAIGHDLDYRARDAAAVSPDAQVAGEVRHEAWRVDATPIGMPAIESEDWLPDSSNEPLERLAVLLIVGLLLAVVAPRFLAERAEQVRRHPVDLVGWGIAALVFVFLLAAALGIGFFVLLALGIGTGLGGLALTALFAGALTQTALFAVFLLALVYVGPVLASAGLGRALLGRIRPALAEPAGAPLSATLALALGAVVYTGLREIPWLGALVGLFASLVGLGAVATALRERGRRAEPTRSSEAS